MSLGFHERQRMVRKRRYWILATWAGIAGVVVLFGFYAYRTGTELAKIELQRLNGKVAEMNSTIQLLHAENEQLETVAELAQQQAKDLERRYAADVPSGPAKPLYDLLLLRLKEGVNPDRLDFVIRAATNPRVCDAEAESKRFIVAIPGATASKDTSVSFAGKTITVSAAGNASVDSAGQAKSWFDPAQPIAVTILVVGGETANANGVLPVHKTLVLGDSEYRFSVLPNENRGFVTVTAQRCNYP